VTSVPAQHFVAAAKERLGELERTRQDIDRYLGEHTAKREELLAQRTQAFADFAAAVLPALTPEAIAQAVRLTGCQALVQSDPLAALAAARTQKQEQLAAAEGDPRYRDRELLRAPRTGTLVRHVEELEEYRAPLAQSIDTAGHPRLERLLESGYGTDAYGVGWWRMSYYADWKAADEILERFPGKADFAALRAELLDARRSLEVYDGQLGDLRREIAQGEALEADHDRLAHELITLPDDMLAGARARIVGHVSGLELGDLAERLAAAPDLALLWKKANGLDAKVEYLDKIVDFQLRKPRAEVEEQIGKLSKEITKWSRPKLAGARYPSADFDRRFGPSTQGRSGRIIDRYRKTYNTVYVYDHWDRPSLAQDLLWWDVMTGGRYDGSYIPQVSSYRQAHPGVVYSPLDRSDEAAAAAIAGATHSTDILHHDAS
jgi:hypothetical protein